MKKINTKSFVSTFLILLFILISISACSSAPTDPDLCEWFDKTQEIDTNRDSYAFVVNELYDKYDTDTLDWSNPQMINEMISVMKEHIAQNEEFIQEWNELGFHPSGKDYWENTLLSIEVFNKAEKKVLEGIENDNDDLINEGSDMYDEANITSVKADIALNILRVKCR